MYIRIIIIIINDLKSVLRVWGHLTHVECYLCRKTGVAKNKGVQRELISNRRTEFILFGHVSCALDINTHMCFV